MERGESIEITFESCNYNFLPLDCHKTFVHRLPFCEVAPCFWALSLPGWCLLIVGWDLLWPWVALLPEGLSDSLILSWMGRTSKTGCPSSNEGRGPKEKNN